MPGGALLCAFAAVHFGSLLALLSFRTGPLAG